MLLIQCFKCHYFQIFDSMLADLNEECQERKVKVVQLCPTLRPHGLYNQNSPGKNTGVGNLSLLHGIFPTQGLNLGLLHYQLSHREAQEFWSGQPIPSLIDLPDRSRNPTLVPCIVGDSLPCELSGKPDILNRRVLREYIY